MYKGLIIQPFTISFMIEEFKELLRFNQLTEQDFKDAHITVEELQAIYNDYEAIKPQLEHEALYLAGLL